MSTHTRTCVWTLHKHAHTQDKCNTTARCTLTCVWTNTLMHTGHVINTTGVCPDVCTDKHTCAHSDTSIPTDMDADTSPSGGTPSAPCGPGKHEEGVRKYMLGGQGLAGTARAFESEPGSRGTSWPLGRPPPPIPRGTACSRPPLSAGGWTLPTRAATLRARAVPHLP